MNFHKFAALCGAAVLALTVSACGQAAPTDGKSSPSASNSTPAKDAGAKAKGDTFTVGFDANFPPYGYKDGDEYVGFDLDLAAEVAKLNEWKLVKQPIDWDSKDMELNSGTIDCIWNGFTLNGREKDYTWSDPYVDNTIVFVTKKDDNINTQADLAGKVVEVQADSSGLTALQADDTKKLVSTFANLTEVPDYNTAFMDMESGVSNAVAVDVGVAKYQIDKRGADKYVIMDPPVHKEQYAVGFKKGNQHLRDQVQKSLDKLKADGTFMKLAEKYKISNQVIDK